MRLVTAFAPPAHRASANIAINLSLTRWTAQGYDNGVMTSVS